MGNDALYSTIAQVLPIFVLALAAERRFGVHERSTDPTNDAIIGIAFIASAAIGEFAALSALAGPPTHGLRVTSEASVGLAGLFLVGDLIYGQVSAHREHGPSRWKQIVVGGFAAFVVVAGALFLALFTFAGIFD